MNYLTEDSIDFSAEIEYQGRWHMFDIPGVFDVTPEGHGVDEVTWTKRDHRSAYFNGTFFSHRTRDNIAKVTQVRVIGEDHVDLENNCLRLIKWWAEPESEFRVRFRYGQLLETYEGCDLVSYRKEKGHVLLHSLRCEITFNWTARSVKQEELL